MSDALIWKKKQLKVFPFKLTFDEAINIIENVDTFEKKISLKSNVVSDFSLKQIYVPVRALSFRGVKTEYSVTYNDHASNTLKNKWLTLESHNIPFGTEELQSYLGYKYSRYFIDEICKISEHDYENNSSNISEKFFIDDNGKYINIEIPKQNYEFCDNDLINNLKNIEFTLALKDIKEKYNCLDHVNAVKYTYDKCESMIFLVPVYVYEYLDPNDITVYKFVNGLNGKISGHKILDGKNIALSSLACVSGLLFFEKIFIKVCVASSIIGFVSNYLHLGVQHYHEINDRIKKQQNNNYVMCNRQKSLIKAINHYNNTYCEKLENDNDFCYVHLEYDYTNVYAITMFYFLNLFLPACFGQI